MDSLDSVSLSRGCFVHIPDKTKRKKANAQATSFKNEDSESLWSEMETNIKQIETKSYVETFNGIVKFINNCFEFPLKGEKEVPAVVLFMGVNMSDHSNLFHILEKHLHLNEICSTVVLESRKCSNMSNMLQIILNEIHDKYREFLPPDDGQLKKQECCFSKLQEYYEIVLDKGSSPKKKKNLVTQSKMKSLSKAIVLLVQDVESFSSELLQELILLSKFYSGKLPIVLVFGMASAMVTLHSILSQKALCCLDVETFHSVPATEYLSRIIEEVIISPEQPFKLGPRVFRLVVDTVLYHDFSVSNLTYLLKFAMIEHLYGKNLSSLCCHESEIEDRVYQLSYKELQSLKVLPSLEVYLDNNPCFVSCINDTTAFKESIIGFVQKLFHHQMLTLELLKILHCFVKDLPGYPLGKQLRELYSLSLEKEIYLTKAFEEAQKLLKIQSQQSLMLKLEACLSVFKSSCHNTVVLKARKTIEDSIEKLAKLSADDFDKNVMDPLSLQSEKITSRFQLQEKIQLHMKQRRSNFEATRNEIIDDLLHMFKNITPPSHFPLHEVFYFDDVSSVKKHLMAVPRVTSCYSLGNPQYYLKCNCCKTTVPEEIQPSQPDLSILYKLHLESGKLINLHDWLEAFKSIKGSTENPGKKHRTKNKSNEDELNIRFLQAVSELQMLGFIKATKRKTDHVARLTFGSF